MGSEWGLGLLRIGGDNSRRLGDPLVRREQTPKATAPSPTGVSGMTVRLAIEPPFDTCSPAGMMKDG
jgi:hypothetical protein